MTDVDAFDHAQATFGRDAGVWRMSPTRYIVGRWLPLAEADVPRVSVFAVGTSKTILRTNRQALVVLGEGTSWVAAFMAAKAWTNGAAA